MSSIEEQIQTITEEIRKTPYHKATEHHVGKLRAKLSKLRAKQLERLSKKGGGSASRRSYAIKKQGDATVVLVGFPSVGKSTLLNKLTNAKSKIAPYAFTTLTVVPGMMEYKDAKIQILDVPGLIEGAEEGKGKGREVLSVVRAADLIILISEINKKQAFKRIKSAFRKSGIRINCQPPRVSLEKKALGGIVIHSNIKQRLDKETIKAVAAELGIKNAEITIKEKLTIDRLIDALSPNRVYIPAIFVVNKTDLAPKEHRYPPIHGRGTLFISARQNIGLEKLRQEIWKRLLLIRIYPVKAQEKLSLEKPIIMKKRQTLRNVAEKIGSEFAENKKSAKIWGRGAKYPGQEVSLTTPVREGMQVRFI